MNDIQRLLEHYVKGVQFPAVSGFEVLELLDVRSHLAELESQLDMAQRAQLEEADGLFLDHAPTFYESVAAIGDLSDIRCRASVACSHWWWYLERLASRQMTHV
ncbi:MAG: hypothetical protein HY314_17475 [Acidobacteria bacterium]|nr:hypothetical protein [Acidobacteriota bacterium]